MEYMLDTLNLEAIKKWNRILPLAGVTSNPSIAKKEGDIDFLNALERFVRSLEIRPLFMCKSWHRIMKVF
ncbi:fructose-6-phosphate aldolase [Streptococcus equi subsp. equi]|nr:fructose-6-phosphate aldolase [Streptococcus equi subsp. equi]